MTADFGLLLLAGILCATGVYLLLERAIIKILLGIMIFSNGINLLILAAGGPPGSPPIRGRARGPEAAADSDALTHGMILTAIGAFILALAYRSYQFTTADEVADDAEDTKIAKRSPADAWSAPDRDLSDDHATGQPTELGDHVDYDDEDLEEAEAETEAEAEAEARAQTRSRAPTETGGRARRGKKNPDDGGPGNGEEDHR